MPELWTRWHRCPRVRPVGPASYVILLQLCVGYDDTSFRCSFMHAQHTTLHPPGNRKSPIFLIRNISCCLFLESRRASISWKVSHHGGTAVPMCPAAYVIVLQLEAACLLATMIPNSGVSLTYSTRPHYPVHPPVWSKNTSRCLFYFWRLAEQHERVNTETASTCFNF